MKASTEMETKKRKRKILIVEDNELNRELLNAILEDEYTVLTAENGEVGLQMLSEYYRDLSVVLLDVNMPVCDGFEFLRRRQGNPLFTNIPVIVTTGSNNVDDEVKCLDLGASDFVTKPYNARVVLRRVRSIIKLSESVATLSAVEFDALTGLFTMQAFNHHAKRMLTNCGDKTVDLIVADLKEFKLINGSFGVKKGDEVLVFLARVFDKLFENALIARQADKFFVIYASENRKKEGIFDEIRKIVEESSPIPGIVVNFGYYPDVDKTQPVSILCDRVVMAALSIKNDYSKTLAIYDDKINSLKLEEQKLERDFNDAINDKEFVVWYQPKYDCNSDKLVGAEALVRWQKKDGSMISPGSFIPLFEEDGLIARLDEYVFKNVCEFQKSRIEAGKSLYPISVNLSRNTIYNPGMISKCIEMVNEYGIPMDVIPVEITESAATGKNNVHRSCETLIDAGFKLHMDDFGAGYSSLSNLSVISFSVIKLDKSLIDEIGNDKGEIVVRHIIGIARELGLKVVAEGVENENQVAFLKANKCDQIQGFFYSRPVDRSKFELLIE